jgi:hypothetical protein
MDMEQANESLVTQFRESGLTQEAFCKNNDISLERLRYYLYKKKPAIARNDNHGRNRKKTPSFISFQQPAEQVLSQKCPVSNYTIVHGTFSCKQLAELIRELEGSVC